MQFSGDLITQLCAERAIKLKELCEKTGQKYTTVHRAISERRDPPFRVIDKFAEFFDVPLSHFSPRRASIIVEVNEGQADDQTKAAQATKDIKEADLQAIERGLSISTDVFLNWLDREDGVLRNDAGILDVSDLFFPAKFGDTTVHAARIGPSSLAKVFFELDGIEDYQNKVSQFDKSTMKDMISNHVAVQETGAYRVEPVSVTVTIDGIQMTGKYRRIMAAVKDEDGQPFTIVFARLTHAFLPTLHVRSHPGHTP